MPEMAQVLCLPGPPAGPSLPSPMALVGVGVQSDSQGFLAQQSGLAEELASDTQGPLCETRVPDRTGLALEQGGS